MNTTMAVLQFLVFPGLLFTGAAGLVAVWIDRKLTARVQMRVGPPFLQPLYDLAKLMVKETCVPAEGSLGLFLLAPLLGLAAVTLASTILWRALLDPTATFVGDLLVVIYLLAMPALATILGAFASSNPLASIGGSREMKLLLAYELPLVLALLVPVLQAGSVELQGVLEVTSIRSPSGILALLVALVCTQAKLALVPFDMAEAEAELSGGAYIEYSGPPLAMYKLTRAMMLFTMPVFLVVVFAGGAVVGRGGLGAVLAAVLWLVLLTVIIVIHNTTPRLRTDQAVRLFWGPVTLAALVALGLAWLGA